MSKVLPKAFFPKGTYDCIRVGGKYDGGYLVEKKSLHESKALLALGIGTGYTFEKDFLKLNPVPLQAYDVCDPFRVHFRHFVASVIRCMLLRASIARAFKALTLFWSFKNLFRGEDRTCSTSAVGYNGSYSKSLGKIIEEKDLPEPFFIKCDIEGGEYWMLNDLLSNAQKISGLVIELHAIELHMQKILDFIEKFPLELVHIHPNNCDKNKDTNLPLAIEMTFARQPDKLLDEPTIPHQLDYRCVQDREDIRLSLPF